jgi:predicted ArsR family transcriptional regulator
MRAQARMEGLDFPDRVRTLATILDEDGYLASCRSLPDGRWEIVEHNCAILDVAQHYGTACGTELAFLQEVMAGADVQRTAHMMAGAHVCAYEITPAGTGGRPRR